jgi:hypothetical protein
MISDERWWSTPPVCIGFIATALFPICWTSHISGPAKPAGSLPASDGRALHGMERDPASSFRQSRNVLLLEILEITVEKAVFCATV